MCHVYIAKQGQILGPLNSREISRSLKWWPPLKPRGCLWCSQRQQWLGPMAQRVDILPRDDDGMDEVSQKIAINQRDQR